MGKNAISQRIRHEVAVQRFAAPLRDAAPRDLEAFWENRHKYNQATNVKWEDAGPCNFAGRATCLVADPKNAKILYAGSAAGGLWKTEDGGKSWFSCWPSAVSQNIGAVIIDPEDCSRIICATGEGNLATASYPGSGIYVSRNGGRTWRSYVFVPGQRRMSSADRDRMPRRVACIAIGPNTAKLAKRGFGRATAFGTISNDEDLPGGLYMSTTDGGLTFVDFWSDRPYNCYSVVFHPTEIDVLYAAIEAGGAMNGIWRSTDGGNRWEQLTKGMAAGERCGRIGLAISASKPDYLLALVSSRPSFGRTQGNKGQGVLGVYRSFNGGDEWERYTGPEFKNERQLAFNNTIAIHPENHRIAMCGAQNLFLTDNEGRHWRQVSDPSRGFSATERNPSYVHADQHAIVFLGREEVSAAETPKGGGATTPQTRTMEVVYTANDGGIARGEFDPEWTNGTWSSQSHGMGTIMFYAIDVSAANGRIYGGGSQDNGTLLAGVRAGVGLRRAGEAPQEFTQVVEGDGGYVVCDPDEEELVFASTFETRTSYHPPGRRWANGLFSDTWLDASPEMSEAERDVLGLTVMAIKPRRPGSPRELFLGTNRLWRSRFRRPRKGSTKRIWAWRTSEFSSFDGSAISAIEIAAADSSVMYVGTARGGIFRSDDGGKSWTEDLAGPEIPNRVITQIETHPKDARTVVITAASTGRPAAVLGSEARPFSHVFHSTDAGRTWRDIDGGKLPNVVINGLAFETRAPYRIFVGGDAGPWVRLTDGRWVSIAGYMPSAVIQDVIYHHKTRTLFAGTYGRGIWRLPVPDRFRVIPAEPGLDADSLLPPVEGYQLDRDVPVPRPLLPEPEQVFDVFPRKTAFACTKVKGAVGYVFEAMSDNGFPQHVWSERPEAEMIMSGADGFTWKCWALMPMGHSSFPSKARHFQYTV